MKKLTAILLALVLLLSAAALCGCSAKETKEPETTVNTRLCGLWSREYKKDLYDTEYTDYFHFFANGNYCFERGWLPSYASHYTYRSGEWAVVDDELVLTDGDGPHSYIFRLEGDTLKIRESTFGTDGNDWYEYTKLTYNK